MKKPRKVTTRAKAKASALSLLRSSGDLLPGRLLARPTDHKACHMHVALDPTDYDSICQVLSWAANELGVRE